jgi:hypothetical protein
MELKQRLAKVSRGERISCLVTRGIGARAPMVALFLCLSLGTGVSATIIRVPADSTTIQGGIRGAADGDTVLVASGAYVENINFLGKGILVTSESGPESTIIDGSAPAHPDSGSVVYFVSGEDSNSIISGFTITGGSGTYMEITPSYWSYYGGGILCAEGSAPLIVGNVISGNVSGWGAGIGCYESDPRITRNVIEDNDAESDGGGLACYRTNARIECNLIANCTSVFWGGGLECFDDHSTIVGNTIIGNTGTEGGGI